MWPGQQPPGGEQNPQNPDQQQYQQPGYPQPGQPGQPGQQQPNPYQQPGYQQQATPPQGAPQQPGTPAPGTPPPPPGAPMQPGTPPPPGAYQQQGVPQWNAPTAPLGAPQPPGGGGRNKTTVTAIVAATAVVIAAGVTGFLVLGGEDDSTDESKGAEKKPTSSAPATPSEEPSPTQEGRGNGTTVEPVIDGWQVVVNPKRGTAFDVPPGWVVKEPDSQLTYIDEKTDKPVTTMTGITEYKPDWCRYDEDKDGRKDSWKLAAAGTKGANGAKNTGEAAQNTVGWWVYGPYTQPSQKIIGLSKPSKYKSKLTGLEGSIAYAESQGVPKSKNPCATEGKALSFAFKNEAGDFVVWSLFGPMDVKDEVSEATIKKILSSVRLAGMPRG
ncbi:hypothetical protein [Streptomyces cavernicola]|uniref:DUF8017 domain-containing protein n=1 Tax=Streptomyces cavernicola TaxID=3043613 RepID=A0ABT6SH65_9ACTN|nr:hypothetical protein [Streptomyces sp. B-S-A6]MDI3407541.1 hypothetical protein [Streptomyces sp. B-S-A6]